MPIAISANNVNKRGVKILCSINLLCKTHQAYYEKFHYVACKNVEEDITLSLVQEARKDFPRMGAKKLLMAHCQQSHSKYHYHPRTFETSWIRSSYRLLPQNIICKLKKIAVYPTVYTAIREVETGNNPVSPTH
jgi:hypothetical protein